MGQKDKTEKLLEDYNDVFADIINVLIFDGKKQVSPEALEDAQLKSQYKADDSRLHEQERDVMKYWKEEKVRLAVCGLENQTKIEEQMPLRIIGYEGANYRSQYGSKHIVPVVTLVLHFGTEKRWDKPLNLYGLINIPDGLENYVNDYHINVVDIAWLTEEQINQFTSDFSIVANFFVNKRKNPRYVPDDKREIKHVDAVLKFLFAMTGDEDYEKLIYNKNFKKEGASMCSVAQSLKEEGRAEGRAEGKAEGKAEGRVEGENLILTLVQKMYATGRGEEVQKVSEDAEYRMKIMREFDLK